MADSLADLFGLNNNNRNSFDSFRLDNFKPTEFKPIMGGNPDMQGVFAGLFNVSNALTGYANNKIREASRDTTEYSTNMFLNELQKAAANASQEEIPYVVSMFSDILQNDQSIMQDKGRDALNAIQARTAKNEAEQLKLMLEMMKKGITGDGSSGSGSGGSSSKNSDKTGPDFHILDSLGKDRDRIQGELDKFSADNSGAIINTVANLTKAAILDGSISNINDIDNQIGEMTRGLGIPISTELQDTIIAKVKAQVLTDFSNDPDYKNRVETEKNTIFNNTVNTLVSKMDQSYVTEHPEVIRDWTYRMVQAYMHIKTKGMDARIPEILNNLNTRDFQSAAWTGALLQSILDMDYGSGTKETAEVKKELFEAVSEYYKPGENQDTSPNDAAEKFKEILRKLPYFKDNVDSAGVISEFLAQGRNLHWNMDASAGKELDELMTKTAQQFSRVENNQKLEFQRMAIMRNAPGLGTDSKTIANKLGARGKQDLDSLRERYIALKKRHTDAVDRFNSLLDADSAMPVQPTEADQQAAQNTLRKMNLGKKYEGGNVTSYWFSDAEHFNNLYNKSPVMQQALKPIKDIMAHSLIDFDALVNKEAFALGPYLDGPTGSGDYAIGFGNHFRKYFKTTKEYTEYVNGLKQRVKNGEAFNLINDPVYMDIIAWSLKNEYQKFSDRVLSKNLIEKLSKDKEFQNLTDTQKVSYISQMHTMLFLASYRGDLRDKMVDSITDLASLRRVRDKLKSILINGKTSNRYKFEF